jgi:amino acid transporter
MIAFACFIFFAVLALRSLVLAVAERKSPVVRVVDLLLAALFALCAALILIFTGLQFSAKDLTVLILIFLAIAVPATLLLLFRIRRPYRRRSALFLLKTIAVLLVVCAALLTVMMTGFINLTEDQPILKITMTGNYQEEPVEWKSPNGDLQHANFHAYEVVMATPEGKPVSRIHIYGDQVAVKAKLLRFRPIVNVIGIHNLCKIDYVYNGYTTLGRFNSMPHHAEEITLGHPLIQSLQYPFWNYWESFYIGRNENPLVKSATVESNYFPLVYADGSPFRGSYYLTITPGGLSSVPLP